MTVYLIFQRCKPFGLPSAGIKLERKHFFGVRRLGVGRHKDKVKTMDVTRVTVDELKERMDRGEQFAFVDARNPKAWGEANKKLPRAIRIPGEEIEQHLDEIPRDRAVITYCT